MQPERIRWYERLALWVVLYVLGAIVTFGHAYHRVEVKESRFETPTEQRSIGALMGAFGWPLYWSARVFKPTQPIPAEKPQ